MGDDMRKATVTVHVEGEEPVTLTVEVNRAHYYFAPGTGDSTLLGETARDDVARALLEAADTIIYGR